MARTVATVMVALAVAFSIVAAPAAAVTQDGGPLGGDGSDDDGLVDDGTTVGGEDGVSVGEDGVSVGGDAGVEAGSDGVSVGGDEGVNASTDGASVAGEEVDAGSVPGDDLPETPDGELPETPAEDLPDAPGDALPEAPGDDGPELPDGEDAPVETDGSNVAVGGEDGVSVGADGVRVADREIDRERLPGGGAAGDSLPDAGAAGESLPDAGGAPEAPGGSQEDGDVPTGPAPVTVDYYMESDDGVFNPIVVAETEEGPRGSQADLLLAGVAGGEEARLVPRADLSDDGRTYLDLDGDGTATRNGVEDAEAAVYTVNESGGEYLLVLDEDDATANARYYAEDRAVGASKAGGTPGSGEGMLAGALFTGNLAGLGPSPPVGPSAPDVVGGGVECTGEECVAGSFGVNDSVPSNRATKPVKGNYPLPRSTDTGGVAGVPCSKPVGADDVPADRLPGASDLPPGTLPGVPTSLLTNDAVLTLAFGVAPDPCSVTDPVADPVANPAVEPGSYRPDPETDVDNGGVDTSDGVHAVRAVEIGPANGAGTADGVYALVLREDQQAVVEELEVADDEYDYLLLETRGSQADGTADGSGEVAIREDMDPSYAGVAADGTNELGTGDGGAGVTVEVAGRQVGGSISCDASGCQPDYSGLPKLGSVPEVPNPFGGTIPVPGLDSPSG